MPNINLYKMDGSVAGEIALNEKVFGAEYNEPLIHQAVVARLANDRQGTKSTLTRSEVRGGGRKPWRQKGTGRARQGSIRAPQWIKGGIVFAPKSRDFSKKMNVEAKRSALFSALSKKVADSEIIVVEELAFANPKTKEMAAVLNNLKIDKRVLVVTAGKDEVVVRVSANIPAVSTIPANLINTYDVVANKIVLMTKAAVEQIEEAYGK